MAYFNEDRRKQAMAQIRTCYEAATDCGIAHALFIDFGLLLGIVRERDFIGHDDDVDMCVDADAITPAQELQYYRCLEQRGMFAARKRHAFRYARDGVPHSQIVAGEVNTPVRFTWFSLRPHMEAPKFCHWFMFRWNGFTWWSKGGMWVNGGKFNSSKLHYDPRRTEGMMLGIPTSYIGEKETVKFHGLNVRIPKHYGTVLDYHYNGWLRPKKGGSSAQKVVCVVQKWLDQKTWKIHKLGGDL